MPTRRILLGTALLVATLAALLVPKLANHHHIAVTRGTVPVVARTAVAGRGGPPTATSTAPAGTATAADARVVALRVVASTGQWLAMGPIQRRLVLESVVEPGSFEAMASYIDRDLTQLADRLPIPVSELRFVETPLTVDVTIDPSGRKASARVWSVVLFGAERYDMARMVFRTSNLGLVADEGVWKVASFISHAGPTPASVDQLPATWAEFASVTGWTPAIAGVG